MSDTVTKKELAEIFRRLSEGELHSAEADRLDPPKVEPEWPKRVAARGGGYYADHNIPVEVYPAGVVGPVVEAARYHMNEWHGIEKRALHCTCRVADAIAAFDAAVRGE